MGALASTSSTTSSRIHRRPGQEEEVSELKKLPKESAELLLATDEDREGEAIAWHLLEVLKPKVPVRRMVFHEITKEAITQRARRDTRDRRALVDAQEARRILDRLFGYEVSPVFWRKIKRGRSAGCVQSVASGSSSSASASGWPSVLRLTGSTSRRRSTRRAGAFPHTAGPDRRQARREGPRLRLDR